MLQLAVLVTWWVDRRAQAKRIDELEKRAVMIEWSGDIDLGAIMPSVAPADSPSPAPYCRREHRPARQAAT